MQVVSFAARYLTSESRFEEYETCHSGLGGGGLGHFGVNFFYCFFGVLWPSYMHMGWGKCNLPSGKASKGSKSKPILGLDHRFPLYFAILHKVSSVL